MDKDKLKRELMKRWRERDADTDNAGPWAVAQMYNITGETIARWVADMIADALQLQAEQSIEPDESMLCLENGGGA